MAWHIFKKDLRLLGPWAALCAIVQIGLDAMMYLADQSPEAKYLLLAARLFVIVAFLVIAFTVAMAVHQDAIPGTRQDWLTRPIRRRDLLLAKMLFVLAAVHLPMFVADLIEAVAHGFSWGQAAGAAGARNLLVLVSISLPVFGFAALTRTMAQFVGAGVLYFLGSIAASFALSSAAQVSGQEQATNPLAWTGVVWIPHVAANLALAAGVVIALGLLYFRRKVVLARILLPVFVVLSIATTLVPWGWVFAIQAKASADPASGRLIALAYDPTAARYRPVRGQNLDEYSAGAAQVQLRGRSAGDITEENRARRTQGDVTVFVPLRASALPPGALLWADRAEVTVSGADGKALFNARGADLQIQPTPAGGGQVTAYQAIRLPALLFERIRNQPVSLRVDYFLTLMRPRAPVAIAALDAEADMPGVGRCSSGRDSDGDDIALRCLQAGRAPSCVSATLLDVLTGRRNPDTLICAPDYSPFKGAPFPDAISRFEVEAPFRDRFGLAAYPVGSAQLATARMVVTAFEPKAHFTRNLSAPQLRLGDWTPAAAGAGRG